MGIVSATLLLLISISISGFSGLAIPRVWLTRNARSGLRFRACCSLSICEKVSPPFLFLEFWNPFGREADLAIISSPLFASSLPSARPLEFGPAENSPLAAPTHTRPPLTLTLVTEEVTEAGCTEGACTDLGMGTVGVWGCRWEAGTGMGGWEAVWECESARRFPFALDDGEISTDSYARFGII